MKDILKIEGYELLSQKVYQALKKEIVQEKEDTGKEELEF